MIGYGHLGDGNLHLNIMSNDASVVHDIEPFVYEFTQTKRGSISAEHGLGLMKGEKIGEDVGCTLHPHRAADAAVSDIGFAARLHPPKPWPGRQVCLAAADGDFRCRVLKARGRSEAHGAHKVAS